ncbi:MAG: 30S ribosome-binding factor RbfA [Candidatus Kerfeldbacteria bacterium]|nr:30S ribosome-binding factor RbfA [Candidatus Kerfeldbacteria bacterium]
MLSPKSASEPSYRLARLSSLIQHELGQIMTREFEPPPGVLVTLTQVRVVPDLSSARVGISILPFIQSEEVFKSLGKLAPHFQRLINAKLRLYRVPKLDFQLDNTEEQAAHIDRLLDSLKH